MSSKDLYETLGVTKSASRGEIKRAYRKLARKYHPDVNPGDKKAEERFKEVSAAFEVLEDPEKRSLYDELGEEAVKIHFDPEKARAYREWRDQVRSARGPGPGSGAGWGGGGVDFDLGDLFGDVFRSTGGRGRGVHDFAFGASMPETGVDAIAEMTVSFLQTMRGGQREIKLMKPAACESCGGEGRVKAKEPKECTACDGSGQSQVARGPLQFHGPCGVCVGTGRQPGPPCSACSGTGQSTETAHLKVKVPPGVRDGQKIRLQGQGGPGRNGGAPGDLFVTVHVAPHPVWHREGDDLHLDAPVSVAEAMFGAEIEIPTLDGRVKVKVPPGSQSGSKLRLKGKGVPGHAGAAAGDLLVTLVVAVPDVASDPAAAREAADRLQKLYSGDLRASLKVMPETDP
jgi:molecular chaperone DnaJ